MHAFMQTIKKDHIQQMMRHLRDVHSDIPQDSEIMQQAIKIAKASASETKLNI